MPQGRWCRPNSDKVRAIMNYRQMVIKNLVKIRRELTTRLDELAGEGHLDDHATVSLGDIAEWLDTLEADVRTPRNLGMPPPPPKTTEPTLTGGRTLAEVEKEYILWVYGQNNGNKPATAKTLGISLGVLYRKLNQFGVSLRKHTKKVTQVN